MTPTEPRILVPMGDSGVGKRFDRALTAMEDIADPLARLDIVRERREEVERLEVRTVAEARRAGATWRAIGALYGLSKQGAQQRFRPLLREDEAQATDSPEADTGS